MLFFWVPRVALIEGFYCIKPLSTHLVDIAHLPEEHQQLLVELDPLGGARQVGLLQGVVQQARDALQDEPEVLEGREMGMTKESIYS